MPEKTFKEVESINCEHGYDNKFKCRISYMILTLEGRIKKTEQVKVDNFQIGNFGNYTPTYQKLYIDENGDLEISTSFDYRDLIECNIIQNDENELMLYCDRGK